MFLPPALFKSINRTDVGIFFSIYRTASFFPIANSSNTSIIASIILGASIVAGSGVSFTNLSEPAQFMFVISSNVWVVQYLKFHAVKQKLCFYSSIIPDMTVSVGTSMLLVS